MALLVLISLPLLGALGVLVFKSRLFAVAVATIIAFFTSTIVMRPDSLMIFPAISLPSLALTPLSSILIILTSLMVLAIIMTSEDSFGFIALLLGIQAALFGVFCARTGLLFYIFWEMTLIPAFFMIVGWGSGDKFKIAIRFLLYNLVGSFALLAVLIYLFLHTHSFAFADWMTMVFPPSHQLWLLVGLMIAFGIKLPLVPFHRWQPDTYECLPRSGTMLFSGLLSKLGIYGILVVMVPLVPHAMLIHRSLILTIISIGVIYASVVALAETGFKRVVATVSIAHGSMLAAGVFSLTPIGIQGGIVQIVAHSLGVTALFLCEPRVRSRFYLGILFLSVLGSIGLPLTVGFIGEFLILLGLSQVSLIYALVCGVSIVLGAWVMLTLYQNVQSSSDTPTKLTDDEETVLIALVSAIFILGIFPSVVLL